MYIEKIDSTPIQKLSDNINNNIVYVKRDDLIPISFGGNKARKAIKFFEDIKLKNSDCIVTYGSSSSNHCRIISNIAASKKMPCYIISLLETSNPTLNSKMIKLFGADVTYCPVSEVKETIKKKLENLRK